MIYLYSDLINRSGGIETYLHALALKLDAEGIPFRVAVTEGTGCPLIDELEECSIDVYRQPRVPGDRWNVRHHSLLWWLRFQLQPGDWYGHSKAITYTHNHPERVLLLRYEDMLTAPVEQTERIAEFCNLEASEEEIRETVERGKFSNLQKMERGSGSAVQKV